MAKQARRGDGDDRQSVSNASLLTAFLEARAESATYRARLEALVADQGKELRQLAQRIDALGAFFERAHARASTVAEPLPPHGAHPPAATWDFF
jgi:hypothetical protein